MNVAPLRGIDAKEDAMRNAGLSSLLAVVLVVSSGCTTTGNVRTTHYTLAERGTAALPRSMLLLPVKVTVNEISVGGVTEPVPQWGEAATRNVATAVEKLLASTADIQVAQLPSLSEDEQSQVDEHLALYEAVAFSAYQHTGALGSEQAWPQKLARFDYTIGPGLRFLKEKTGAEAAVIVVGEDNVSSAGRKTAVLLAALLGIGLQLGYSGLTAGVIDLETGNVLWLDFAVNQATIDLRTADGSRLLVDSVFQKFPGRPVSRQTAKTNPLQP